MDIQVTFDVGQPIDRVWQALQDVPMVLACVPGLEAAGERDGSYRAKLKIKLGPVAAAFEGEGRIIETDPAARIGRIEGKGTDRRGGSRVRATAQYRLSEVDNATRVQVDTAVDLTGSLAKMGRIGIFQDVANQIAGQFADNLGARLAGEAEQPTVTAAAPAATGGVSVIDLLFAAIAGRLRRLFAGMFRSAPG